MAGRIDWTPSQSSLLNQPVHDNRVFVYGPAGSGKTTAACQRLINMLEDGYPSDSILLFVPQRTLAAPYQAALSNALLEKNTKAIATLPVQFVTLGGLARRMADLFWPLIADQAGFQQPEQPPVFLTLETTLHFMAQVARPYLDEGAFSSIHLERNRLYSQVIDNLNKSAVVGFPSTEIAHRLKSAWAGEPAHLRVFDDVQVCANRFREYCLANNLLDFSLQVEIFTNYLWPHATCRNYLTNTYQHLFVDNIEEDTPASHAILSDWLQVADSALLLFDTDAGYRRFLGADPDSAWQVRTFCNTVLSHGENIVSSEAVKTLGEHLRSAASDVDPDEHETTSLSMRSCLVFTPQNYFPQMLDWTAEEIYKLIESGTPRSEIAVLSPYLSDSLRYSLAQRLNAFGIATRTHRPSRALREEPVTNCLLTMATIAHQDWTAGYPELVAKPADVAYALIQAIEGLDLVRAQMLVQYSYKNGLLDSFTTIPFEIQERISFVIGERYEQLRAWLTEYHEQLQGDYPALDHFFARLFGEVLSQPGYGFHVLLHSQSGDIHPLSLSAGEITANLIESIQKFRRVITPSQSATSNNLPVGLSYILMVQAGLLAAQYIRSWVNLPQDAVLLAPAYTFLLENRPVDYQFWLDPGSRAWAERLYQPLTHPFVLSRAWPVGRLWTDLDEVAVNRQIVQNLTTGLLRRCRKKVFLGICNLGEQGYEQRGPLLQLFQQVMFFESKQ